MDVIRDGTFSGWSHSAADPQLKVLMSVAPIPESYFVVAVGSPERTALEPWRTEAAPRFGLEPGVLLPNRLIGIVAEAGPRDAEALAAVDGFRRWRVDAFGGEILAALAGA